MATEPSTAERIAHHNLSDEQGPIPTFPPVAVDEQGRALPMSETQHAARRDAALRALKALDAIADSDPPDAFEEGMRDIDACRPEGQKLFEQILEGLH